MTPELFEIFIFASFRFSQNWILDWQIKMKALGKTLQEHNYNEESQSLNHLKKRTNR